MPVCPTGDGVAEDGAGQPAEPPVYTREALPAAWAGPRPGGAARFGAPPETKEWVNANRMGFPHVAGWVGGGEEEGGRWQASLSPARCSTDVGGAKKLFEDTHEETPRKDGVHWGEGFCHKAAVRKSWDPPKL